MSSRESYLIQLSEQKPPDRDAREAALEALPDDAFAEFDEGFLAYEDDLSSLLYAYVQAHSESIRDA